MKHHFYFTFAMPFYFFIESNSGPESFDTVLKYWWENHVEDLSTNTKIRYTTVQKCFEYFKSFNINDIKSQDIDLWIEMLIYQFEEKNQGKRKSFTYELNILKSVFRFCNERRDSDILNPIRKRHYQRASMPKKVVPIKSKNLTKSQFDAFMKNLSKLKYGEIYLSLSEIHFFHALRISEVTAIYWEDLHLDENDPEKSFLRIQRSHKWIAKKGVTIDLGFKNSKAHDLNEKILPLFPETYKRFKKLRAEAIKNKVPLSGLIFHQGNGQPFTYRMIQHAYDKAFKKAGLQYTGTHILRHGGSRHLYRKTRSLETAQQLLGNVNIRNTIIYTEVKGEALSEAILKEWNGKKKVS